MFLIHLAGKRSRFTLKQEGFLLEPSESVGCLFSLSKGFCRFMRDLSRFILKGLPSADKATGGYKPHW